MDTKQINQIGAKYYKYSIWLAAGMTLLTIGAMGIDVINISLAKCLAVSAIYTVAVSFMYGFLWKYFAKVTDGVMTKFYLAASALRLVTAALVVAVFCMIVQNREMILGFVIMFFVFYVIMLIFDSVFFARIEKCNNQKTGK